MTRAPRGFTLLELLVALVVFGFIAMEIGQGVDFGVRASRMQTRLLDQRSGLDGVNRVVRDLVAHMDPGSSAAAPQAAGTATSFSFVTDLPPGSLDRFARHADVRLLIDGSHRFVLRWTQHLHSGSPVAATPSEDVLLDGVQTLQFSYLYPAGASSQGWTDRWSEGYLPRLVRLHIGFPENDARHWPDIIAEPAQDRPRE